MNPQIFPILLDKTKIEFLKKIHHGLPTCKDILKFMCSYYEFSEYKLLHDRILRKYFVYLCYKIHSPEYFNGKSAKSGICKKLKSILGLKTHAAVKYLCDMLKNEIKIYCNTKEEVLNLERNLHMRWRGGW